MLVSWKKWCYLLLLVLAIDQNPFCSINILSVLEFIIVIHLKRLIIIYSAREFSETTQHLQDYRVIKFYQ